MSFQEIVGIFFSVSIINATVRQAIPITLGAVSGIFSERSSIVNIGIEGMMLMGAFSGYMANVALSDPAVLESGSVLAQTNVRLGLSVLVGVLTGGAMGLFHALLCIQYKVDHIISGTVINILALGITGYFYDPQAQTAGKIPALVSNPWPRDHDLYQVGRVVFDKSLITYLTFLIIITTTFALFRTVWGLRTRAIGENPRAADTLGINVFRLQYANLFLSGVMAGLAGAYLSLDDVGTFERGMSAGKGFIALAVMILGKWHPVGALIGALLFGYLGALQNVLQFAGINVPNQFVSLLPYLGTIIVLAGFVGQSRPPAHIGKPYEVEGH